LSANQVETPAKPFHDRWLCGMPADWWSSDSELPTVTMVWPRRHRLLPNCPSWWRPGPAG